MKTFIETKLKEKDNNIYKEIYDKLNNSIFDPIEIMNEIYTEYNKNKKVFEEKKFINYLKNSVEILLKIKDEVITETEMYNQSDLIKIRVYLQDHTEMVRELNVISYNRVCDLVYSVLASFNATNAFPYLVRINNKCYVPDEYLYVNDSYEPAESVLLKDLNLKVNDKFKLSYDDGEWVFIVKILEIIKNENLIEEPQNEILKFSGYDIFDGNREIFDILMNNTFEELKIKYTKSEIEYYKAFLKNNPSSLSQEVFIDRMINLMSVYENNYDDDFDDDDDFENFDLKEFEDEDFEEDVYYKKLESAKEQYLNKISNKPHYKKYQSVLNEFKQVIDKMNDYFEMNIDLFVINFEKTINLINCNVKRNPNKNKWNINNLDRELFYSCLMLPMGYGYESVSESIKKANILSKIENDIMDSMINSHFGLYKINFADEENAIVSLEDVITHEKFKIVDGLLSLSLSFEDEYPLMVGRVYLYKGVTFANHSIFINNNKKVKKYIEDIKKYYHTPFEIYNNINYLKVKEFEFSDIF